MTRFAISSEDNQDKPNVLFIVIDDLNDWIGYLGGHPDVKTPNIDRLAIGGCFFANAHCAAPLCNPSRAAVMTGIRPSTSGVYYNDQPWRQSPALRDVATIPQQFKMQGYKTLGGGKVFGQFQCPDSWDKYWPSIWKQVPGAPKPPKDNLSLNGFEKVSSSKWGVLDVPNRKMRDWQVAGWVIKQLKQKHEKPFFLACGFSSPHLPWYIPREYFDMYPVERITLPDVEEDDLDDVPLMGKLIVKIPKIHQIFEHLQWRKAIQGYLASITFVDDCIGRVMDSLSSSSYADNTVIVLWSDHGFHLGEKRRWGKSSLWEEATHVPLVFVVPGLTKPNGTCPAPVSLIDIYPTLIDLCGLKPPEALEGISLVPLLKNPERTWRRPALTTHHRNNHTVRSERWRFIRYSDGTEELYDHSIDPQEWNNLANDPKYSAIKEDLIKWLPEKNAFDIHRDKEKSSRDALKRARKRERNLKGRKERRRRRESLTEVPLIFL
jgi:arylsulfatase A-like enzyme